MLAEKGVQSAPAHARCMLKILCCGATCVQKSPLGGRTSEKSLPKVTSRGGRWVSADRLAIRRTGFDPSEQDDPLPDW